MNKKMSVYLLNSRREKEITVDIIYEEFRSIISSITNIADYVFVFPNASNLFNFIRSTNDKMTKELLRSLYDSNNMLTSKCDIFKRMIRSSMNIIIIDYFGMDPKVLHDIYNTASDNQIVISFVMNPDITMGNSTFPYSSIVNNMIVNKASDDELLVYLAIYHGLNDDKTSRHHIQLIRQHMIDFDNKEFITLDNVTELKQRILT